MAGAGVHVDIFSAAAKLRADASFKSRIADFSLRAFLAFAFIGGGLLSLAALLIGACSLTDFIVHHIAIVSR